MRQTNKKGRRMSMSENKTAIQVLTQTIEELATKVTQLEMINRELKQSSEDWYKFYCEKKEMVEKLTNELNEARAELQALKTEKGE